LISLPKDTRLIALGLEDIDRGSSNDLSWLKSGPVGGNILNMDKGSLWNIVGPCGRGDNNEVRGNAVEDTICIDVILGIVNNFFSSSWEVDFESPVIKLNFLNGEFNDCSVLRMIFPSVCINEGDGSIGA